MFCSFSNFPFCCKFPSGNIPHTSQFTNNFHLQHKIIRQLACTWDIMKSIQFSNSVISKSSRPHNKKYSHLCSIFIVKQKMIAKAFFSCYLNSLSLYLLFFHIPIHSRSFGFKKSKLPFSANISEVILKKQTVLKQSPKQAKFFPFSSTFYLLPFPKAQPQETSMKNQKRQLLQYRHVISQNQKTNQLIEEKKTNEKYGMGIYL